MSQMSVESKMPYDRDLEMNFREITCKRQVGGAGFPQGVQDYDFSVSGKNAWIPGYSYFRIDASLYTCNAGLTNQRVPIVGDGLSFADTFGGCLYNNAYFRAGGQDVSTITQFLPQASILKARLDRSGAWLEYLGQDGPYNDADFNRRVNKISSDGNFRDNGLVKGSFQTISRAQLTTAGAVAVGQAAYDNTTGILTISVINIAVTGIQPGDVIEVITAGPIAYEFTVIKQLTATTLQVKSNTIAVLAATNISNIYTNIATDAGSLVVTAYGQNSIYSCYQPPLGIFDVYNGLGSGDFKIQLNPNANYQVASVQSLLTAANAAGAAITQGNNFNFVINDVRLYVCQVKKDMPPSGVLPLSLMELNILNKPISSTSATNQLDFTVPPSTLGISVFVQANIAGTDTRWPPTVFNSQLLEGSNLSLIQVTYGSVTKPMTLYSSGYTVGLTVPPAVPTFATSNNYMIQRWMESNYNAMKFNNEGGPESFRDWMERGPLYHFDFSRDKNDSSSYVNVQIQYANLGNLANNPVQLFIVAHYSRQIEISYENGFITQVVSVNR